MSIMLLTIQIPSPGGEDEGGFHHAHHSFILVLAHPLKRSPNRWKPRAASIILGSQHEHKSAAGHARRSQPYTTDHQLARAPGQRLSRGKGPLLAAKYLSRGSPAAIDPSGGAHRWHPRHVHEHLQSL